MRFALTVQDSDHLPAGMSQDDVAKRGDDVALAALLHWYNTEAKDWLACEPT